jgi:predicted dehydrogenase
MDRIEFGIVGAGWRAEFYLRIAHACSERFAVAGMVVRNPEKGRGVEERWGVPTFRTPDEMLDATSPLFVVTSVPWGVNPDMLKALAERGMPALSETPPAPDLEGLRDLYGFAEGQGARVQVAEQYHLQPLHAARIAVARGGRLGAISQAQVSVAHGYHGISIMRRLLGIGFEDATIRAFSYEAPVVAGPGRKGPPETEEVKTVGQQIALFDFDGRLGLFDFTSGQYFNWVRSNRLLVRGERGEMTMDRVTYLEDYRTPIESPILARRTGADGNLEGLYLQGVQVGEEWLYRNPFAPACLTDDEIAVAECLARMARYVGKGEEFYSLAEASQDHYLGLMMDTSVRTGQPVRTERQPWAG